MIAPRSAIAIAGFVVGAVGAALEQPHIVWAAIVLLGIALGLRLIAGFRERRAASASDSVSAGQDE